MAEDNNSSKTIALLVAIIAITAALMGAEAWNRAHKGQKSAVVQAAAVTAPVTPAPEAVDPRRRGQKGNGPDHGTPDTHGEIMNNQ